MKYDATRARRVAHLRAMIERATRGHNVVVMTAAEWEEAYKLAAQTKNTRKK